MYQGQNVVWYSYPTGIWALIKVASNIKAGDPLFFWPNCAFCIFIIHWIIVFTALQIRGRRRGGSLHKYQCKCHLWFFSFLFFLGQYFFIMMLTAEYVIRFQVFLLLFKLKKWRRPYLCRLFTHALPILTLVEPNQYFSPPKLYSELVCAKKMVLNLALTGFTDVKKFRTIL